MRSNLSFSKLLDFYLLWFACEKFLYVKGYFLIATVFQDVCVHALRAIWIMKALIIHPPIIHPSTYLSLAIPGEQTPLLQPFTIVLCLLSLPEQWS